MLLARAMDPRQRALDAVRPFGRVGVELGALNRPLLLRTDGDVLYADHLSTEALRHKYAGHDVTRPEADPIVDVDLVLEHQSLVEALGARGPVDYVVASHVMEHLPDPIGWLRDLGAALKDEGVVFLAMPDMRFTFDHRRTPSTTGDLIAHHVAGARVASPAQVFEHVARTVTTDLAALWAGAGREPPDMFQNQLSMALAQADDVARNGTYVDVHCTAYTPYSFADVFREIVALDLIPFEIAAITPTALNTHEFFVTLRKRRAGAEAAAAPRLDPRLHHALPEPEAPVPTLRRRLGLAVRAFRAGGARGTSDHR